MSRMRQRLLRRGISPQEVQQQRGEGHVPTLLENRLDYKGPPFYLIALRGVHRLCAGGVLFLCCRFGGEISFHSCLPSKKQPRREKVCPHTLSGGFPARLESLRFDTLSPYLPRIPGEGGYCKPPLAGLS